MTTTSFVIPPFMLQQYRIL